MKRLAILCSTAAFLLSSCSWRIVSVYENALTPIPSLPADEPFNLNLTGPDVEVGSSMPYVNGTVLAVVPTGPFMMGHGGADNPAHQVTLDLFWMFRTKVTNAQFARCVAYGQCTAPDAADDPGYADDARGDEPVVGVTYAQAVAYCVFMRARLPSEAEWEKSARGPRGDLYPWGQAAPSCRMLNFNDCVGGTTNVGAYPDGRSYYGVFDMEGNTFEWVADWYDPLYYQSGPAQSPLGPDLGQSRSVRSSSYASPAGQTAAALRFFDLPGHHRPDLGFRCVVDKPVRFDLPGQTATPTPLSTATLTAVPSLTPSAPPNLLPTLSAPTLSLPTLSPTKLPIDPPTLIPAPIETAVKDVCVPKVCTLPYLWDVLRCKCVLP